MAGRKQSRAPDSQGSSRRADRPARWNHEQFVRPVRNASLLILGAGAFLVGLLWLERWSQSTVPPSPPIRVEWVGLPEWLRQPANAHILDDLTACVGLSCEDNMQDADLTRLVAERLSQPEVGWVEQVRRVVKRPPDSLQIDCDFRRPVAWIRSGDSDYLVDAVGVRLPGRYQRQTGDETGLIDIDGVRRLPPPVGARWEGEEVAAALRMVRLIEGRAYAGQIRGIRVEWFQPRGGAARCNLVLLTNRRGGRILWGRPPGDEDEAEIPASQKLALLERVYEQTGRVDMNQSCIDVTVWPDRVSIPALQASSRDTLRRG